MAGKKLAGLKPPAASVEASGIVVLFVREMASQQRGVKICTSLLPV